MPQHVKHLLRKPDDLSSTTELMSKERKEAAIPQGCPGLRVHTAARSRC